MDIKKNKIRVEKMTIKKGQPNKEILVQVKNNIEDDSNFGDVNSFYGTKGMKI